MHSVLGHEVTSYTHLSTLQTMGPLRALFLDHMSQPLSSIPRERCFSAIRYNVDFSCIDRTSNRRVLMHQPKSQKKSPLSDQLGKSVSTQPTPGVIGPRSGVTSPWSSRIRMLQTPWRDREAAYQNPNASDASSIKNAMSALKKREKKKN